MTILRGGHFLKSYLFFRFGKLEIYSEKSFSKSKVTQLLGEPGLKSYIYIVSLMDKTLLNPLRNIGLYIRWVLLLNSYGGHWEKILSSLGVKTAKV